MHRTFQTATKRFVVRGPRNILKFPHSAFTVRQRQSAMRAWLCFVMWTYPRNPGMSEFRVNIPPTASGLPCEYTALLCVEKRHYCCKPDSKRCYVCHREPEEHVKKIEKLICDHCKGNRCVNLTCKIYSTANCSCRNSDSCSNRMIGFADWPNCAGSVLMVSFVDEFSDVWIHRR